MSDLLSQLRRGELYAERRDPDTSETVMVELPRQVAEEALISTLAQGEDGARRYHARKAVDVALRDALDAEPASSQGKDGR